MSEHRAMADEILRVVDWYAGPRDYPRERTREAIERVIEDYLGRTPRRVRSSEVVPVVTLGHPADTSALVDCRVHIDLDAIEQVGSGGRNRSQ